ncbi:MAG: ABC transporter permease [Bacteroidota bacterium]|nr:ABC transporter permease [Bacteroidota bacterium]
MINMLKNYLKTALRNLWRHKGYSIINLTGLAIGMAACLLILIYIIHELSYDRFHEDHHKIFRVAVEGEISGDFFNIALSNGPMAKAVFQDFPEVAVATRVYKDDNVFFSYDNHKYYVDKLYYVDTSFLDIFSFHLLRGNQQTVLKDPHHIILSESMAEKYFGAEDPLGKVIKLNDAIYLTVSGIIEDAPANTHLKYNMLTSIQLIVDQDKERMQEWGSFFLHTYVKLHPNASTEKMNQELPGFMIKYIEDLVENENVSFKPYLQSISSIHLHSHLLGEISPNGDAIYIYIFSSVALFILLIACINFMNLSTARSSRRGREVGLRKVAGANRYQLIYQFLGESIILTFFAMMVALILVELSMPLFNNLTGLHLGLHVTTKWYMVLVMIIFILIIGSFAGSYPAFYLSSFQPIEVLKGDVFRGIRRSALRNLLVIIQFSISIILLVSTGMVFKQMNYISEKELGFDKENSIIIPLNSEKLREKFLTFKTEFEKLPYVSQVSVSSSVPGKDMDGTGYIPEGIPQNSPWIIFNLRTDDQFIDVMGMEMLMGRNFSSIYATDTAAIIINETLMKKLGWEDPLNKKISYFADEELVPYHIIGVVKDFHIQSLHDPIEPTMIIYDPEDANYLSIKLHPDHIQEGIHAMLETWEIVETTFPFDYFILEDNFNKQYKSEMNMEKLFVYFTILAFIIACLGLFGLASFSSEQRTKEVGIRKVLGATTPGLVSMLTRDLTKWVILANIIAWPAAYLLIEFWLQNFTYRINILDHFWIFIFATVISLAISTGTVMFQAIRVSISNPADAIKCE